MLITFIGGFLYILSLYCIDTGPKSFISEKREFKI